MAEYGKTLKESLGLKRKVSAGPRINGPTSVDPSTIRQINDQYGPDGAGWTRVSHDTNPTPADHDK